MDHVHVVLSGPHADIEANGVAQTDAFDFGKIGGFYVPRRRKSAPASGNYLRGFGIMGGIGRGYPFWHLTAQGEMLPRFENSISLDPHKKDAWGIPAARIELAYGDNENRMIEDAFRTMRRMVSAAGLEARATPTGKKLQNLVFSIMRRRLVMESGAGVPGAAVHEVGGAPMGTAAKDSVLNRFNQCWDADNVFVTDGACFVSSGAQNTTLTIMALTVRACEHILRQHHAGSWR
jgi:choline dehydrogenase-like flavoprotein